MLGGRCSTTELDQQLIFFFFPVFVFSLRHGHVKLPRLALMLFCSPGRLCTSCFGLIRKKLGLSSCAIGLVKMFYQVEVIVKNVFLGILLFDYILLIFETEFCCLSLPNTGILDVAFHTWLHFYLYQILGL